MDEPLAWRAAFLAGIAKVVLAAGLFIGVSTQSGTAQQCGRGQVLIVGRHTCVSHETFQQFQRAWRTGKSAPSVAPRHAEPAPAKTADAKPAAKPNGASAKPPVAAEAAPVPPPRPVVATATPASAAPAPAARDIPTATPAVTTATPIATAPQLAPAAAPAAAMAPAQKPAKKPKSPYGELQVR